MWWLIIPTLIVLFLLVIIVRTLAFKPKAEPDVSALSVDVDGERAIKSLAEMIKCRTVSYVDTSLQDAEAFERFRKLLDERYPRVAATCEKYSIGATGVLYHWKGRRADTPSVFMAHYDVVPVVEALWNKPPFDAVIEDGILWGRGTLDTKGTLCGIMEAAETLLEQEFIPENDMYLAFSGDEETFGLTAPAMVDWFEERGIKPIVLDEGGAIVSGVFPGVSEPCALVGTGEKGLMDAELTLEGKGGHASSPPAHTPVGLVAQAIANIEDNPFPMALTPPAAEMFDTLGRHAKFGMRLIFANLWCFKPLLSMIAKKRGGELNALMRTTCAFTRMQGGDAWNVLPPKVSAGANLRLLTGTPEQAAKHLEDSIKNSDVKIRIVEGNPPSAFSNTSCEAWDKIKVTIRQTWPGVIVSPYLMVACSDSRHYCRISDKVYRFSAMELSSEERGFIHGNNERIPTDKIIKTIEFYVRLMRQF